jgi:hypothetical protein
MRNPQFPFLPKDFIETDEGLIFAVVSYENHEGKVGCFLRYVKQGEGWRKVETNEANQLLNQHHPDYHYYSARFEAAFHAVPVEQVKYHHRPENRLAHLKQTPASDDIEIKLHKLLAILVQYGVDCDFLGLTGSMLIANQKAGSDIDFVVYGRKAFQQARAAIKQAVDDGLVDGLDLSLMQDNFARRGSCLSFEEFAWHESRKFNKAALAGTKFDIGMVSLLEEINDDTAQYQKLGNKTIRAKVIDDQCAFDFPAHYIVDDNDVTEVVSFTHTYVGQAMTGEIIEATGKLERNNETGQCRLVIGSTREALGEYIKVWKE